MVVQRVVGVILSPQPSPCSPLLCISRRIVLGPKQWQHVIPRKEYDSYNIMWWSTITFSDNGDGNDNQMSRGRKMRNMGIVQALLSAQQLHSIIAHVYLPRV